VKRSWRLQPVRDVTNTHGREQLITAPHERCEFERGEVRVADMVTRQPWADDVPVRVLG